MTSTSLKAALLVSALFVPTSLMAKEAPQPKYEDFAHYYIQNKKGMEQEEGFYKNFLKFTDCNTYSSARGNEFKQRKLESQGKEKFAEFQQKDAALPDRVSIVLNGHFGQYDFDKKAFRFTPIKKGIYIPVTPPKTKSDCRIYASYWPATFQLHFTNGDAFQYLPVSEEKAEKLNVDKYRRRARIEMIVDLQEMKMAEAALSSDGTTVQVKNPEPIIKGRIVQMDARIGYVKGYMGMGKKQGAAPLVGSFTEADITKLEAEHTASMKDKPLEFSSTVFAAWADKLAGAGLVEKHGFDTSDIVSLHAIKLSDIDDVDDTFNRQTAPADGKEAMLIKPRPYNRQPDMIGYNTPMGSVAMKIDNWEAYQGKHDLTAEEVVFLKGKGGVVSSKMSYILQPTSYEVVGEGDKEQKLLHVELKEIQIAHRDPITGKPQRTISLKR